MSNLTNRREKRILLPLKGLPGNSCREAKVVVACNARVALVQERVHMCAAILVRKKPNQVSTRERSTMSASTENDFIPPLLE